MWNYLNRISRTSYKYVFILLIIIFSILRFVNINADAPQDLSMSNAIYADEGYKTYSARNMTLFHNWKWTPKDEYSAWFDSSPVATWTFVKAFQMFGVSISTLRSVSIIFSILTMVLIFFFLKRHFDPFTALIGLILYGTNFFNIMFNRLGFFEIQLNFYLIVCLIFLTESLISKKVIYKILLLIPSIACIVISYFIKQSVMLVVVSIIPALILLICSIFAKTKQTITKYFIAILSSIVLLYFTFAYISNINIFDFSIFILLPIRPFDPIQLVLLKGIYLEFIYLQPFTFFLSFLYAIFSFYKIISKNKFNKIDIILSSWLFFGFILLYFMKYHPARYFHLLSIPCILLTARAIASVNFKDIQNFILNKNQRVINILLYFLKMLVIIYSGIILVAQFLPVKAKNYIVNLFYTNLFTGEISQTLPIIIPFVILEIIMIILVIVNRKKIYNMLSGPNFQKTILTLIIIIQLFQYCTWLVFSDNKVYSLSKELENLLPKNSIIGGSWSGSLVLENNFKSLIFQNKDAYNHQTFRRLIENKPIPVNDYINGKTIINKKKDFNLYLAVSPNIIFEQKIVKRYKKFILKENLIKQVQLGYFNLHIYKIR